MGSFKTFSDVNSLSFDVDTEKLSPKLEELTIEEERIYCILFETKPNGDGIKVREDMKECLSQLSAIGLHKDPKYPKFINLGKKAIDNNFDSVEKNRLHVINNEGDSEVICRHKTEGSWEFVAVIEKSLIEKTYNSRGMKEMWSGIDLSVNSGQTTSVKGNTTTRSQTFRTVRNP